MDEMDEYGERVARNCAFMGESDDDDDENDNDGGGGGSGSGGGGVGSGVGSGGGVDSKSESRLIVEEEGKRYIRGLEVL